MRAKLMISEEGSFHNLGRLLVLDDVRAYGVEIVHSWAVLNNMGLTVCGTKEQIESIPEWMNVEVSETERENAVGEMSRIIDENYGADSKFIARAILDAGLLKEVK